MMDLRSTRESGAVAIVVAISAVLIFSLAALAVDLGNAFARKRDIQTEADLAALAAAVELPYDVTNADAIEGKANTFAAANETVGQDTSAWDFTDGDEANGFVELSTDTPNQLRLVTPPATVDFGLAGVMGFSSTDVRAEATVEIRSPGQAAPFYVAESCSTGQQTLIDTSNGHNTPSLDPPSSGGLGVGLTSITPSTATVSVDPGVVTIKGTGLSGVKAVGFTTDGGVYPHVTIPAPSLTVAADGKSISFNVPSAVYDHQFYWYVRVAKLDGGNLKWSSLSSALGFTVGTPYFICDGSVSGNFGLLKLSREDSNNSDWDNRNIVYGIQRGLASWPHPDNVPDDCDGFSEAVEDPNNRQPFSELINCLATDPGLPANAASEGLIGKGGINGRLARYETTEGCDPSGGSAELLLTDFDGNNDYTINNDVLSCFFADTTTTVEDVTRVDSPVENAITSAVFDSPRFLWVPVLNVDPSQGHSGRYAITRFQPVFLTGQPMTATRQVPGGILNNGMTFSNSGLGEMKAIMINPASLPESGVPGRMGTIEYVGTGTKVMTLID